MLDLEKQVRFIIDPAGMKIVQGCHVIVETARGIEYGSVVLGVREVSEDKVVQPLKQVIRVATRKTMRLPERTRKKKRGLLIFVLKKSKSMA